MLDSEGLRILLNALPDAVLICDRDGVIRASNRECETLLGYSPAELVGLPVDTLVPFAARERHAALRERYRERPWRRPMDALQDIEALRKDGRRQPVTIALNPYLLDELPMIVVSLRDNTPAVEARRRERERFEQMLKTQRLESIGVLSCGIAHDFKNLLTVVLGNAELALLQEGEDRSALHASLRAIRTASLRLRELSRQMLSYAAGKGLDPQEVQLNATVEEMGNLLRVALPPATRLRYELADTLPTFVADPVQISQILLNLVLNASEAIGTEGGNITLRTGRSSSDHVFVEVEDDGCGIDDSVRDRILDDFFTTKAGGIGLGLSVVNTIVRRHGGFMRVESRGDKGSQFSVHFPAAAAGSA